MTKDQPLAYHITFGTYGMRLHGDPRGTVHRSRNRPGDRIIGSQQDWQRLEERLMRFPVVPFDTIQRRFVEKVVPDICRRGDWEHHNAACGIDHVHVLLSASAEGAAVRKWLKRWLGQALSNRSPLAEGCSWWAEGGSVKWVWTEDYFNRVFDYVQRQRATKPPEPSRRP
jgi:REP element-mobilizing transposase RayT